MSNTNTEAQRLADHLERVWYQHEAAAELRRLDASEQRHTEMMANPCPEWDGKAYMQAIDSLRAQVKQAELERDEAQTKCQELSAQLVEAGHNEDAWRAQLSKAVAEEREACAKVCESRQANGNRTHTHPDECAAAIRARSNT